MTDPARAAALCNEALDAAQFIRDNVAQARLNDRGNYGETMLMCYLDASLHACLVTQSALAYNAQMYAVNRRDDDRAETRSRRG